MRLPRLVGPKLPGLFRVLKSDLDDKVRLDSRLYWEVAAAKTTLGVHDCSQNGDERTNNV